MMKRVFAVSILMMISMMLVASGARAEINSSGVLGFQSWKASRIEDARVTLEKIQSEAQIDKPQAARPIEAKKNYQKFQQAQLNLQIVQELTVSDYFTLYLSQLKDRSMMLDAAKKLSADEIADLMVAYQKALSSMSAGMSGGSAPDNMTLPLLASPSPQSKPTRLRD